MIPDVIIKWWNQLNRSDKEIINALSLVFNIVIIIVIVSLLTDYCSDYTYYAKVTNKDTGEIFELRCDDANSINKSQVTIGKDEDGSSKYTDAIFFTHEGQGYQLRNYLISGKKSEQNKLGKTFNKYCK